MRLYKLDPRSPTFHLPFFFFPICSQLFSRNFTWRPHTARSGGKRSGTAGFHYGPGHALIVKDNYEFLQKIKFSYHGTWKRTTWLLLMSRPLSNWTLRPRTPCRWRGQGWSTIGSWRPPCPCSTQAGLWSWPQPPRQCLTRLTGWTLNRHQSY